MKASALASRVVGAVNGFLHVAARLLQDLAHLARHVRGENGFIPNQYLAEAEENFGAARRGRAPPAVKTLARSLNRRVHVFFCRNGKAAHHVARVRRIEVLEELAATARLPAASDVVIVRFDRGPRRAAPAVLPAVFAESFFCLSHEIVIGDK